MNRCAKLLVSIAALLVLAACQHPGQNVYRYDEVGKASLINFGTVVAVREVAVQGRNTGLGAATGAAAGGLAGSQFGSGGGSAAATLAGVIIGGIAGAMAEQGAANRTASEYTVVLETGVTMTVVQDHNDGERILQPGERVMLQVTGGTQRVLAAQGLPTEIKRPTGIAVID
jgi:outer membrane lipoprotein SlyB